MLGVHWQAAISITYLIGELTTIRYAGRYTATHEQSKLEKLRLRRLHPDVLTCLSGRRTTPAELNGVQPLLGT